MNVHLYKEIKCNFQSNASDCLLQMSKFKADIHVSPEKYFRSNGHPRKQQTLCVLAFL